MKLRILAGLFALGLPAWADDAPVIPKFTEVTAAAGVDSTFTGDWEQIVGGGVASFDCNTDGFPDMAIAGGTAPLTFYRNTANRGGALQFEKADSGLEMTGVSGVYPLDIDSDGIRDLVLLRVGENVVMRGLGDCRFTRANEDWGFDGGDAWSTAYAATWEKGASWPTIAIGNYIDRAQEDFPWGSCTDNWLHRGADKGFAPPLPLKPSFCALSMLFTDWNRSGVPSLRVSNDREYYKGGQEQLWHLDPGAPPALYTADEGWKPLRIWGMGIASQDVNFDGYPDYFLTSMADSKLQTLAGIPAEGPVPATFADTAFKRGVTAHKPYTGGEVKPSTGWHAQFDDVNNDGLPDLFVAKGNVWEMPDFAMKDPNNLLLQKADGTFLEAGELAGVASMKTARGAGLVDFNLDGALDLIVVNRNEPAELWQNTGAGLGHWLEVRLDQPGVNRDGIGAWLELRQGERVLVREITSGGGHAGGHLGWWHLGLGAADQAEVRVIWPDGVAGDWHQLAADGFYVLRPGAAAEVWPAP
jgi:enediyne biosynthesis protein E4